MFCLRSNFDFRRLKNGEEF